MSVRIACPACDKPLKIAETLLGKELACPKCEARIVAPPIGCSTDPDSRAYTLLCVGCSAVLTIDDQTVEAPVQCSTCGTPVEFADYPDLAAFREEVRAEKKVAQKAAREAERATKEAEKAAIAAEREAVRQAEREKVEAAAVAKRKAQKVAREEKAKAEAETPTAAYSTAPSQHVLRRLSQRDIVVLVSVGICAMLLGYLAGREHIKWEMRAMFRATVGQAVQGFASTLPRKGDATEEALRRSVLTVRIRDFNKRASGATEVTFVLTNSAKRDIQAFKGQVVVRDAFDDVVMTASVKSEEPIAVGKNFICTGYGLLSNAERKLFEDSARSTLNVTCIADQIHWADGRKDVFE